MNEPKVSVIIPVYNGEETIGKCLESILNQNYKNYEVIVVDNNSTDRTKNIIKEIQRKRKKVRYVLENYRSVGAARNSGIKKARGEIIVFTDSDCIVPNNWVREIIKPIISEGEKAVMGFEKDLIGNYWTKNIQKMDFELIKRNLDNGYITTNLDGKNFAIKADLIRKLMFDPNTKILDDFELFLRLRKISKIRFLPFLKVGHYHKNSFIKTLKNNFIRGFWVTKIQEKHKKDLKDEIMTQSISLKNFLLFPFWICFQFIKRPFGEAYFLLISEFFWRAGIIWAKIKKLYEKLQLSNCRSRTGRNRLS